MKQVYRALLLDLSTLALTGCNAEISFACPDSDRLLAPGSHGNKILYVSDSGAGTAWDIYAMNADGTGQTRLTNDPEMETYPAWSPDGKKIAFAQIGFGAESVKNDVYVMNADGTGQTRLTNHLDDGGIAGSPAWSPDGTKIAYMDRDDGQPFVINVMNADGSGQTRLNMEGEMPAWSPDGTKIAFFRILPVEIYVMNADGSGETFLTYGDYPAWSPDGKKIAFASTRDGEDDIFLMNPDGSGQVNLTIDWPCFGSHPAPDWSPDGTKIVYMCNGQIFVMNADGSGQTNLTNNDLPNYAPDWGFVDQPCRDGVDNDGDGKTD